jgi:hypothetical protein
MPILLLSFFTISSSHLAQNDFVLAINFLGFFSRRKILEKKKKKKKIGSGSSHPFGQNWVAGPPHFWPRSHPHDWSGGKIVVWPLQKGKPKKKKKVLVFWGPPPRA